MQGKRVNAKILLLTLRDLYSGNLKWIYYAENIIQNSDNQEYSKDLEKIRKRENQEYKGF